MGKLKVYCRLCGYHGDAHESMTDVCMERAMQWREEILTVLKRVQQLTNRLLGTGRSPNEDYEVRMAWNGVADDIGAIIEKVPVKGSDGP